jgi:hypothetical protein
MNQNTFLIGDMTEGLRKETKPWSQANDAFETLTNCYQWRGRLVKRSGYTSLGRLPSGTPVMGLLTRELFGINLQELVAFDQTTAYNFNGTNFVPLPSVMPVVWSGTNFNFFTGINYAGAFWVTNGKSGLNGARITNVVVGVGIVTFTTPPQNFANGQHVTFINVGGTIGPDVNGKTFVIQNVTPTSFDIVLVTAGVWTANGFALNSEAATTGADGIRYYGQLRNGTGWANYNPPVNPFVALAGALLMFTYRGYLVFLNTFEGNDSVGIENFGNRARWIQIGTPYYSEPVPVFPSEQGVDVTAGRDDLFGKGGANDAPTNETIVAAGFVKDILIVYFTRSTWRLRFVNNQQNPFVWERLNVELGSSSTGSTIIFDKGIMAIGNRGIVISDGNDTQRFDTKIPDDFFNIREVNQGFQRVQGIRTFRTKLNYWTFPSTENNELIFPEKVLVFNYDTKNWSYFEDSFTCFGYYYPTTGAQTWQNLTNSWSSTLNTWDGGNSQGLYENVVAGNQQGYIVILEETNGENSPSLSITSITSVANTPGLFFSQDHNLLNDETWIKLSGITGTTSDDGVSLNGRNFQVNNPMQDPSTFSLSEFEAITAPNAVGTSYYYTIDYDAIYAGSVQINIGSLVFKDPDLNGVLVEASALGAGTINYTTGVVNLTFNPAIASTPVFIRVVSNDPTQGLDPVITIGVYGGGGEISIISGLNIESKVFNFFEKDQRGRLSKIDFYTNSSSNGQFTVDIFPDSSNEPINTPLRDNLLSNIVLTQRNPYQFGTGDQVIYRLYCDAIAQTLQMRFYYSDAQMAVSAITNSNIEILAMMVTMRPGGRLI